MIPPVLLGLTGQCAVVQVEALTTNQSLAGFFSKKKEDQVLRKVGAAALCHGGLHVDGLVWC